MKTMLLTAVIVAGFFSMHASENNQPYSQARINNFKTVAMMSRVMLLNKTQPHINEIITTPEQEACLRDQANFFQSLSDVATSEQANNLIESFRVRNNECFSILNAPSQTSNFTNFDKIPDQN
jgi:hypothetical protein